ncbi:MAG TPA: hypothetical protein VG826_08985 [Pirellulales bacterium]|nr:hypothetical protein [Pirellulales bacterium]
MQGLGEIGNFANTHPDARRRASVAIDDLPRHLLLVGKTEFQGRRWQSLDVSPGKAVARREGDHIQGEHMLSVRSGLGPLDIFELETSLSVGPRAGDIPRGGGPHAAI